MSNDYEKLYKELIDTLGYNSEVVIRDDLHQKIIERIKKLEKLDMIFKTTHPDLSGSFFICGASKFQSEDNLPEFVHICPSYGVEWAKIYKKIEEN